MPKIAFVGAGSTVFTRNLVGDVLYQPELRDRTEFALMDIAGATVTAITNRRAALDGADYVVTSFQVGGYEPSTVIDFEVLNYANPMAMLCWAAAEASTIRTVGLCHSVQGTAAQLADDLGLPSVDYEVAGINHDHWIPALDGRSLERAR